MPQQVYWDDVEVGADLPALVKRPSTQQLVKWAGASGDYAEIHYDKDYAQQMGLSGVIVHGWLTFSFIAQMVTDWIGEGGTLKKLGVSYRGMNFPGNDIICKGRVTGKHVKDNDHCVELEIWAENAKGEKNTPGKGVVVLPQKDS